MAITNPLILASTATALRERIPAARDTDHEITNAANVVTQAGNACSKMSAALKKIRSDQDISNIGKAKQAAQTVRSYSKPVLEELRKAQARVKERRSGVVITINKLPDLTADEKAMGMEIRKHCKSLTLGNRVSLLLGALKNGDTYTVRSLIEAPPFLTGLPEDVVAEAHTTMRETLAPSETKERTRLDNTLNILNIMTDNIESMIVEHEAVAADR